MTELEILKHIRKEYGDAIDLAARLHRHRPEVLAGIMMRETQGGLSPLLIPRGPAGKGDGGHGHGLMQIDDRSFPDFCAGSGWKTPSVNIMFGAMVLAGKRKFIASACLGLRLADDELERAGIAAYNCGEGRVSKQVQAGKSVDEFTASKNYSAEVLRYSVIYAVLAPAEDAGVSG